MENSLMNVLQGWGCMLMIVCLIILAASWCIDARYYRNLNREAWPVEKRKSLPVEDLESDGTLWPGAIAWLNNAPKATPPEKITGPLAGKP